MEMLSKKIRRIRTGGQSGVDRAAMDFARERGIPLCGWCPKTVGQRIIRIRRGCLSIILS